MRKLFVGALIGFGLVGCDQPSRAPGTDGTGSFARQISGMTPAEVMETCLSIDAQSLAEMDDYGVVNATCQASLATVELMATDETVAARACLQSSQAAVTEFKRRFPADNPSEKAVGC